VATRKRLTRAEQQEETRSRLLEAAVSLCGRKGLHAATVEEIADAAGYTRGAVYSNFRDRDDLLRQVFERRVQDRLRALAEMVENATPDAQEQAVGEFVRELAREERDYLLLLSEFWGYAARRPPARRWFARVRRRQRSIIREMIEQRTRHAEVELRVPAEHLAAGLLALELGILLEGLIDSDLDVQAVHNSLFGLIYRASVAPPRRRRGSRDAG
jgi:AcrR family transcriptional regulator